MLRPTTILSSMWTPLLLELLCYLNGQEGPLQKNSKQIHDQNSGAPVDGAKRTLGKACYIILCIVLHNLGNYISY